MDIPESFKQIDVPLPPMLLAMAGVKGNSRFVGFYYRSSKATWNDSRGSATFPFYTVWQPYIQHLAIAINLFDAHLGSDDCEPIHALVCDHQQEKVYVAPIEEAMRFLETQHSPRQTLTPQEWEVIKAQYAHLAPLDMSQMQNIGMFEIFMPPSSERKEAAVQLVRWLDQYINEALILKCLDTANAGNYRAVLAFEAFKRRCE